VARLTLTDVSRRFGETSALDRVSIDVADGELLAVLGPSGCGKTTLLRAVAGFDPVDSGRIAIGDRVVSDENQHVPPEERRVGIVFQSYALWPHMSVAENVGYPLKVAKVPVTEREQRIREALALVGLADFGRRRPAELSGGQRQRVALARCLIAAPSLVLLDEPLANLDVHLRAAMEAELASLHRRTSTTMVFITHDQIEAMALADRIAVMDKGQVLQVASPAALYREPASEAVARFVGEGMVVPVTVQGPAGDGQARVTIGGVGVTVRAPAGAVTKGRASVCLRPRDLTLGERGTPALAARAERLTYRGGAFRLEARTEALGDELLRLEVPEPCPIAAGDAIEIAVRDGWLLP
jgi:iron(III) transport system ATP-binding protein